MKKLLAFVIAIIMMLGVFASCKKNEAGANPIGGNLSKQKSKQ